MTDPKTKEILQKIMMLITAAVDQNRIAIIRAQSTKDGSDTRVLVTWVGHEELKKATNVVPIAVIDPDISSNYQLPRKVN